MVKVSRSYHGLRFFILKRGAFKTLEENNGNIELPLNWESQGNQGIEICIRDKQGNLRNIGHLQRK